MRIMGLDVGTKTIGVAVSDELGWTAQGVEVIRRNEENPEQEMLRLEQLARQYQVQRIVVGLPKNMNGSIGERGEACLAFGRALEARLAIPVDFWDERLSTVSAERTLIDADISRKKRKKVIDKLAAMIILQNYLDAKR